MILEIDTSKQNKVEVRLRVGKKKIMGSGGNRELLQVIENILRQSGEGWEKIEKINFKTGPGSFTGLKVGAAVANSLAWSLKIPVNGGKPPVLPKYE